MVIIIILFIVFIIDNKKAIKQLKEDKIQIKKGNINNLVNEKIKIIDDKISILKMN